MQETNLLTEKVQELEIAMKNSTGVEAMAMAGVLTATKKKLAGTTTGININSITRNNNISTKPRIFLF